MIRKITEITLIFIFVAGLFALVYTNKNKEEKKEFEYNITHYENWNHDTTVNIINTEEVQESQSPEER